MQRHYEIHVPLSNQLSPLKYYADNIVCNSYNLILTFVITFFTDDQKQVI